MKKTIFAGSILMLLCSCSVARSIKKMSPRGIDSYEITSQEYSYNIEIFQINLYDKKGKIKGSVKFYFDIESGKAKRFDKNGNIRVNTKNFPALVMPKYYTPRIQEI